MTSKSERLAEELGVDMVKAQEKKNKGGCKTFLKRLK